MLREKKLNLKYIWLLAGCVLVLINAAIALNIFFTGLAYGYGIELKDCTFNSILVLSLGIGWMVLLIVGHIFFVFHEEK